MEALHIDYGEAILDPGYSMLYFIQYPETSIKHLIAFCIELLFTKT